MKYKSILAHNNIKHCPGCLVPYKPCSNGIMFIAQCKHPDGFESRLVFRAGTGALIRATVAMPELNIAIFISYGDYANTSVRSVRFFTPKNGKLTFFTKDNIVTIKDSLQLDLNDLAHIKKKIKLLATFS